VVFNRKLFAFFYGSNFELAAALDQPGQYGVLWKAIYQWTAKLCQIKLVFIPESGKPRIQIQPFKD